MSNRAIAQFMSLLLQHYCTTIAPPRQDCNIGRPITKEECKQASKKFKIGGWINVHLENLPCGCSIQTEGTGAGQATWSDNLNSAPQSEFQLVCMYDGAEGDILNTTRSTVADIR